jgi:CheY-like chemotaxis protein
MERTPATIVVLEEHAAAQELIEEALREAGDRVLLTNNPMEIIGLATRVRIDLLVTDIDALESTEPKLAEKLRSIAPVLQIGGQDGLRAPFSLQELQDAVSLALDRQTAG